MCYTYSVIRIACVVFATATLASLLSGPQAYAAGETKYCGFQVPPYTECFGPRGTHWYENFAHYAGAGVISLCERVDDLNTGGIASRRCDTSPNYAASRFDLNPYYNAYLQLNVGNHYYHTHTIEGTGRYH